MARQARASQTAKPKTSQPNLQPMTFIDHVHELRRRLFWVALWFVVVSGAVFPFFQDVIKLLMRPLGHEKLYYLTPVGGLSFMFKVCMYIGFIATLPVLIYQIYRFLSPVMRRHNIHQAIGFVVVSFMLAAGGVTFAYLVSLPAAMHFLTHFGIAGVSPMLTVDSYLSFIVAYLLAGALLFQLPLVMSIIDSIHPTPPSFWLKYERHMVVAALIVAMLITPTPNISDQVIMALPIMVMYQIGIGLVALRHRSRRTIAKVPEREPALSRHTELPRESLKPVYSRAIVSDFRPTKARSIPRATPSRVVVPARATVKLTRTPRRSIDGISIIAP
ncbi:MAG TPA: twin-arginine translocase subunit TatC [Candidatus Saccharimonadaceae bacterium]|nr:twin-arginine translocase subunit TatC [Candidatus Saccharimonadaceae bacterium]